MNMITLLQNYLRINTAYPHPAYQAVVDLFKQHAQRDGFVCKEVTLPSGNPVIIITLEGTSKELPALALNHHMDVVSADNYEEWTFPPFQGTLDNGIIYGRGAQDCKGLGVIQYEALKRLKERGIRPARTIHLIIVPDEESGGYTGTKQFLEHPVFDTLGIGYVLDEGMPSGDPRKLLIKVDERTPMQIRIASTGPHGHASGLLHDNCVHTLIAFLADIVSFQKKQQRTVVHEPGAALSINITSLATDTTALNVIPSCAVATIDMRIPPRMAVDEARALFDAFINNYPTLSYEILATSKERCTPISLDSPLYVTLAQAIAEHGLQPQPFIFEASTDARFYSHKGIQTLGCTPFTNKPNLHGTDESVSVQDLEQGCKILSTFLQLLCVSEE